MDEASTKRHSNDIFLKILLVKPYGHWQKFSTQPCIINTEGADTSQKDAEARHNETSTFGIGSRALAPTRSFPGNAREQWGWE